MLFARIDPDDGKLDPGTQALGSVLASALRRCQPANPSSVPNSDMLWEAAQSAKCTGLMRLAGAISMQPGSAMGEKLALDQIATLRSNLAQLAETMECQMLLEQHGISSRAFKGVVRQQQLFHRADIRRSSDIDLLVTSADYPRACAVLTGAGYRPGVGADSRWWHQCLGESPYLPAPPRRFIVDLHHQVQQPGGPSPRQLAALFQMSAQISFGGGSITTLTPHASLLVTMISYSKAVRDLAPWAIYAHEIEVAREGFSPADYHAFLDLSASQGLRRLAEDAFRNAELFWDSLASLASGRSLNLSQVALVRSGLGKSRHQLFRRTALRWAWADGERLYRARHAFQMALSEYRSNYIRRREERAALSDA